MLFGLGSPPDVRFCGLPEKHAMKNHRRENLLTRYPQLIAECLARHVDVKRSALAGPVYIASQPSLWHGHSGIDG